MSDEMQQTVAPELVELVREYSRVPGLTSRDAVALAVATMQCDMLNDMIVVLGDHHARLVPKLFSGLC